MTFNPDTPEGWAANKATNDGRRATRAHSNARTRGKVWERQVAAALGTKRTGPTGLNDADVIHDTLAVECKALGRLALRSDHLEQAIRNAKGRQWVLAIKEYRTGRRVVVIDFDHFIALQSNMEDQ